MRDMKNKVLVTEALVISAITSDTTTVGTIVDTRGYDECLVAILSGALATGVFTPVLEYGDASDLADAAAVPSDMLGGTLADATFAATDDRVVKTLGYVGDKRYIRLSIVTTGGAAGGIAATAILGRPTDGPTS